MRQLIYRDWILIKKSKSIYYALLYLLFLIPNQGNSFVMNYSTNFLFIFVVYLFFSYLTAYDYKYEGLTFTGALPVSKRDIVVSRYVFIGLSFLVFMGTIVGLKAIINLIQKEEIFLDVTQIGFYVLMFSLFFSIITPLYYKLGYQKIRWAMFIGMFVTAVTSSLLAEIEIVSNGIYFLLLALLVGSGIYWFSARVSSNILLTKDL